MKRHLDTVTGSYIIADQPGDDTDVAAVSVRVINLNSPTFESMEPFTNSGYFTKWNFISLPPSPKVNDKGESCGTHRYQLNESNIMEYGKKYFIENFCGPFVVRHIRPHIRISPHNFTKEGTTLKTSMGVNCDLCGVLMAVVLPVPKTKLAKEIVYANFVDHPIVMDLVLTTLHPFNHNDIWCSMRDKKVPDEITQIIIRFYVEILSFEHVYSLKDNA